MSWLEYVDHFSHVSAVYHTLRDVMSVFCNAYAVYWERIFAPKCVTQQVARRSYAIKVTKLATSLKASACLVPDAMSEVSSERSAAWVY